MNMSMRKSRSALRAVARQGRTVRRGDEETHRQRTSVPCRRLGEGAVGPDQPLSAPSRRESERVRMVAVREGTPSSTIGCASCRCRAARLGSSGCAKATGSRRRPAGAQQEHKRAARKAG